MGQRSFRHVVALVAAWVVAATLLGLCAYRVITKYSTSHPSEVNFRLTPGQRIFLVARDDWTDNWSLADDDESQEHIAADTRAEGIARNEFTKKGRVTITNNEHDANFIFLLVVDPNKPKQSVLGEVLTVECYSDSGVSTDRCASKWTGWGENPAQVVQKFYAEVQP